MKNKLKQLHFLFSVSGWNPRHPYNLIGCMSGWFFAISDHGHGNLNAQIISHSFRFIFKWKINTKLDSIKLEMTLFQKKKYFTLFLD